MNGLRRVVFRVVVVSALLLFGASVLPADSTDVGPSFEFLDYVFGSRHYTVSERSLRSGDESIVLVIAQAMVDEDRRIADLAVVFHIEADQPYLDVLFLGPMIFVDGELFNDSTDGPHEFFGWEIRPEVSEDDQLLALHLGRFTDGGRHASDVWGGPVWDSQANRFREIVVDESWY